MNKLINTFTRGFSLKNDDFRFIDDSVRDAIADIVNALSGGLDCVLWGCGVSISGTTASVGEGAIWHANEVWHVDAHTFTVLDPLPEPPLWVFYYAWDAAGAKLDADLVSHNTYQLRKAKGSKDISVTGYIDFVEMPLPTLEECIDKKSVANVAFTSGISAASGSTVNVQKKNNICQLRGSIIGNITTSGIVQLTLPSGFRPPEVVSGYVPSRITSGATQILTRYEVGVDGTLKMWIVDGVHTDEDVQIHLGGISFRID